MYSMTINDSITIAVVDFSQRVYAKPRREECVNVVFEPDPDVEFSSYLRLAGGLVSKYVITNAAGHVVLGDHKPFTINDVRRYTDGAGDLKHAIVMVHNAEDERKTITTLSDKP